MAGARGYSSYRGRGSKLKVLLAVVLVLIILAAVAVMLLQKNVVYDENGTPQIRFPWQTEEPLQKEPQPLPENVEVVIQPAEPQEEPYAVCNMAVPLDPEVWSLTMRQFRETTGRTCDAVVVTLKDRSGDVWFDSAAALSGALQAVEDVHDVPIGAAVSPDVQWHSVARIVCFQDPRVARHYVTDRGLQNKSGYIFHDGNNSQWLSPAKPFARRYLCAMIVEAAELGFDEILLSDVCYPTEGKLEQIAYGEGAPAENIALFLQEVRTALADYEVRLSIELPEAVILSGRDETAGLVLADIVQYVDRIYAATTADQVPSLAQAVEAASETVEFIPHLSAYDPEIPRSMIG